MQKSSAQTPSRSSPKPIDPRGPRFNQAVLAVGLVVGFVFQEPWVVVGFLVVLGLGAIAGSQAGLFLQIYARLIKPRLGLPAEVEDPRPPRFAALVGTVFLAAATVAFALGAGIVGWVLALIVAALAALAAVSGLCVGCEIYTFLVRRRWRRAGTGPPNFDASHLPQGSGFPDVVLFTSPYCVACRRIKTRLDELEVSSLVVDLSEQPRLAGHYDVATTPTLLALGDDGAIRARYVDDAAEVAVAELPSKSTEGETWPTTRA